jgi:polysaccharide pyruvyl transferase WcaK-like protein
MTETHQLKIGIAGASLDTGNYGVNALAEGSVKCLAQRWPGAEFVFLASGRSQKTGVLSIEDRHYEIPNLPIRFCRNVFLKNHYLVLFLMGWLLKLAGTRRMRALAAERNPYVREILSLDCVADITGGDSFTDLYGPRRFIQGGLIKYLWLLYGKPVYFLPQTYGPFQRGWVRRTARFLLARASAVYCRDRRGLHEVKKMLALKPSLNGQVAYVPDVAFVLDAEPVQDSLTGSIQQCRREGMTIAGLNVSGLLYHGGYTRKNMFALKADYPGLVGRIASALTDQNCALVLVPHVFPPSPAYRVESDTEACRKTAEAVRKVRPDARLLVADGSYSHNQLKYLIGLCDFFVGSRMHACIAALSQCVPAVGIAYSDKFAGVFESAGLSANVIDAKSLTGDEIVRQVGVIFRDRARQKDLLEEIIPAVQRQIEEQFSRLSDRVPAECK